MSFLDLSLTTATLFGNTTVNINTNASNGVVNINSDSVIHRMFSFDDDTVLGNATTGNSLEIRYNDVYLYTSLGANVNFLKLIGNQLLDSGLSLATSFVDNDPTKLVTSDLMTDLGNFLGGQIAVNVGNIGTNATNIATNVFDILTNAGAISVHTTQLALFSGFIGTNSTNIATNTSNITTINNELSFDTWHYVGGSDSLGTTMTSYQNDVATAFNPSTPLRFKKTFTNTVIIEGVVDKVDITNFDSVLFYLPSGYRPLARKELVITGDMRSASSPYSFYATGAIRMIISPNSLLGRIDIDCYDIWDTISGTGALNPDKLYINVQFSID
jgi:hypothetical protein